MVLDSIAFHFRSGFEDMAARTRVLAQLAQALIRLAEARDVAVRSTPWHALLLLLLLFVVFFVWGGKPLKTLNPRILGGPRKEGHG